MSERFLSLRSTRDSNTWHLRNGWFAIPQVVSAEDEASGHLVRFTPSCCASSTVRASCSIHSPGTMQCWSRAAFGRASIIRTAVKIRASILVSEQSAEFRGFMEVAKVLAKGHSILKKGEGATHGASAALPPAPWHMELFAQVRNAIE